MGSTQVSKGEVTRATLPPGDPSEVDSREWRGGRGTELDRNPFPISGAWQTGRFLNHTLVHALEGS